MKTKILFMLLLLGSVVVAFSFKVAQGPTWVVPAKFQSMANPVKSDASSLAEGKSLWGKHCQSCHGKTGLGDGSKAAQLKTEPGDFTKSNFHSQTDGAIFYKIVEGREDMPSFKKKIPDQNEIWSIVNYIRTFKR
jgi:mono/diheme cytochrome c family protein